jgi:hypothetical protein
MLSKLLFIIFLIPALSQADVCETAVKFSIDQLSNAFDKLEPKVDQDNPSCSKISAIDELIAAGVNQDEDKMDEILNKVDHRKLFGKSGFDLISKVIGSDFKEKIKEHLKKLARIAHDEMNVLLEDPIKGLLVMQIYKDAEDEARNMEEELKEKHPEFKQMPEGADILGRLDAVRHIYINAMASRFGLYEMALKMGSAHEATYALTRGEGYNVKDFYKLNLEGVAKMIGVDVADIKGCNPGIAEDILLEEFRKKLQFQHADNLMDFHNNKQGRLLARDNPCASKKFMLDSAIQKVLKGEAVIVDKDDCNFQLTQSNQNFTTHLPPQKKSRCMNNEVSGIKLKKNGSFKKCEIVKEKDIEEMGTNNLNQSNNGKELTEEEKQKKMKKMQDMDQGSPGKKGSSTQSI